MAQDRAAAGRRGPDRVRDLVLQPPLSDDALYGRIMDVAREGESGDLAKVEDEIDEFLQRFPDDERAQEVRALHEELDCTACSGI